VQPILLRIGARPKTFLEKWDRFASEVSAKHSQDIPAENHQQNARIHQTTTVAEKGFSDQTQEVDTLGVV